MPLLVDRELHPALWWIWAAAMAVAATRTTHIGYALLIVLVSAIMVDRFRGDAPWSRAFGVALTIAAVVLAIRLVIGLVFAVPSLGNTLFEIPQVRLPSWVAGITLGGPVTSERLGSVLSEGMVIVAMIAAIGVATALTNPRRLIRILPASVHEVGVALIVATTFIPQLVMSVRRVQAARRLRGHEVGGVRGVRGLARPVVDDAIDRALALAASMEARGYGRAEQTQTKQHVFFLGAMIALGVGGYGMLAYGISSAMSWGFFTLGLLSSVLGLRLAGRGTLRSVYRAPRWGRIEWTLLTPALVTAVAMAALPSEELRPSYSTGLLPPITAMPIAVLLLPLLSMITVSKVTR